MSNFFSARHFSQPLDPADHYFTQLPGKHATPWRPLAGTMRRLAKCPLRL